MPTFVVPLVFRPAPRSWASASVIVFVCSAVRPGISRSFVLSMTTLK